METVKSLAEQKVFVDNASWGTYERLLREREERRVPRFFYDRGMLEIVSLGPEHERISHLVALMVELVAEELDVELDALGSTTFRREDIVRGFEPDQCFYVRNEALVRGKIELDLTVDLPPDLVVEIDITSPSIGRFPIYARFGVPEIWRYDGERIRIFELERGEYAERAASLALPPLTSDALTRLVKEGASLGRRARVREWARSTAERSN